MAALVQTIPPQTSTITLLQPRPSSSTGAFPSSSHSALQQHSQMARNQQSRASYNGVGTVGGYRTSQAGPQPVAPYAFTSTPGLTNTGNAQIRQNNPPLLKTEHRAVSAPSTSHGQPNPTFPGVIPSRVHFPAAGSVSNSSPSRGSKDDSAIPTRQRAGEPAARSLSSLGFTPPSLPNASPSSPTAKPSPDRYRRGQRRVEQNGQTQSNTGSASSVASGSASTSTSGASYHSRGASADDAFMDKPQAPELAKRYRRRSLGSLDTTGLVNFASNPSSEATVSLSTPDLPMPDYQQRPHSAHSPSHRHNGSSDSVSSTRSLPATMGKRNNLSASSPTTLNLDPKPGSSVQLDTSKRTTNPSPLSKPLTMSPDPAKPTSRPVAEPSQPKEQPSPQPKIQSPAARRLAEISKKGLGKTGKSRLRRALSFGSVAELRGSAVQDNAPLPVRGGQEVTRRQQLDEELGEEQAAIAQKQEANGLGENIYSGQGIFSGSMDNLSISSTASSASIMLRKMGKGMRRSTRSLVGLFRPKSALTDAGDSAPAEPMTPQVSIVNVEADRENTETSNNVTEANGLAEPAQERSSVDTGSTGTGAEQSSSDSIKGARKNIVGGGKERAEVLTAVKRGILKRPGPGSNTSSPVVRPVEPKGADVTTANIPHIHDSSPHSSAPSTPSDDHPARSGHRRTDSITIEGEDYFLPVGRFNGTEAASAPVTPQPPVARNISFSPRIQFHDTWPSGEYDRRGEIATCNRLTPLLAQQIKEELNTFKMEMEVHESSKVYTHFF
ncbi:bud neck involved protein [Onygenales sp. PD_40]|nr:bud neck involved protein [Onygenales sp. PD_40]KAK2797805.1 bud neck involved protein [Onygenales sp. PD_10]